MSNNIIRIYQQGWNENLSPIDYLNTKDVTIVKYIYSSFGGCYFIEIINNGIELNKKVEFLDIEANIFNWNK